MNSGGKIVGVCPDSVPRELKNIPCWLNWKLEPRRTQDGTQRMSKVPYRADGKGCASSVDPESWSTFDDALATYQQGQASGIGFVFVRENGIVGVDLDHCFLEDGNLHHAARRLVEQLDSYTEKSVSGSGLHVLLKSVLSWDGKRRDPIELYSSGRYFTVTGQVFEGRTELNENQAALDQLISTLWPPRRIIRKSYEENLPCRRYSPDPDDRKLLAKARNAKNGRKFSRLYDGDWHGFNSQSEGDAALLMMLTYWTGGDRARTEALFRESGLYRPKFDRKDYRDRCFSFLKGRGS